MIELDDVKPGMKFQSAVRLNDIIYISAGKTITLHDINKLRNLGIVKVHADFKEEEPKIKQLKEKADKAVEYAKDCSVIPPQMMDGVKREISDIVDFIAQKEKTSYLSKDLEAFDSHVYDHSTGTLIFGTLVGNALGLTKQELRELGVCLYFHDIGKIKINSEKIWNKPGKLTPEEFALAQSHVKHGYIIMNRSGEPGAGKVAGGHHAAKGYTWPLGQTINDIDLYTRIASVVDIYDALVRERPYRKGDKKKFTPREALKIMADDVGKKEIELDREVLSILFHLHLPYGKGHPLYN
jgi:HD-GYP domain-containing protein (c-di-GMP phosphodiesterase class II)